MDDRRECLNCGRRGHSTRDCILPIISAGIVLMRKRRMMPIEYLFIRRRSSFNYVEFVRGNYNVNDKVYIMDMLRNMTVSERKKLLECMDNFEKIWKDMWIIPEDEEDTTRNYNNARNKFNELVNHKENNFLKLHHQTGCIWLEPEWGIPKGRRNFGESLNNCSIREFQEETGISPDSYKILDTSTFEELFTGSNNVKYHHIYSLAVLTDNELEIGIDKNNFEQVREVGDIAWLTFDQICLVVRKSCIEKMHMLGDIRDFAEDYFKNNSS